MNDAPTPPETRQGELDFQSGGGEDGHEKWVALRRMSTEAAARRLNLPVGHRAEVWLRGGIRLRGTLRLVSELLFVEEDRVRQLALVVDGVTFNYGEIESCVRLD